MGDGIQRRFAIIINGDTEPLHLENVERAVTALRAEGRYEISVASTQNTRNPVEHYAPANETGLRQLISGIHSDDDDQVVVYVTGHGGVGPQNEGCVELSSGCYPFRALSQEVDRLNYGRRIIVIDNCFGGGALSLFANPRSTVVTQGSPGETVSCQQFSPYFWSSNVPDENHDGVVAIQERYAYALREGRTSTHPLFYESSAALGLSGRTAPRPPFESRVVEVHNEATLQSQLQRLQPGQLALVTFSADWCGPCRNYQPIFDALARQMGGRFLMIRAEGQNGSEGDWQTHYGVRSFPTVAFVDRAGVVMPVPDRDREHPLDSLLAASLQNPNRDHTVTQQPETIEGITWPVGAQVYIVNGRLRVAISPQDITIQGILVARGTEVVFYAEGRLLRAALASDQTIQGISFARGTGVIFDADGRLGAVHLASDQTIQGISFARGTDVEFSRNGRLARVALASNQTIQGTSFARGTIIEFDANGRAFLAVGQRIRGLSVEIRFIHPRTPPEPHPLEFFGGIGAQASFVPSFPIEFSTQGAVVQAGLAARPSQNLAVRALVQTDFSTDVNLSMGTGLALPGQGGRFELLGVLGGGAHLPHRRGGSEIYGGASLRAGLQVVGHLDISRSPVGFEVSAGIAHVWHHTVPAFSSIDIQISLGITIALARPAAERSH